MSASEVYDSMIQAGAFKKMERTVSENTKFNCAKYLVQLEADFINNKEKK